MSEETKLPNVLDSDSVLVLSDAIYYIALYDPDASFDKDHAYLNNEYFYLYRGTKSKYEMDKPGIYKLAGTKEVVLVDPSTPEEKEYYAWEGKISTFDPAKAADLINSRDDLFIPLSDNCKIFNPEITVNDDILKRLLKLVFKEKEIDIDMYKDRFPDKNALFNFKQIMKGPGPVTMKIFQRICDVIDVEFCVLIREKDNGRPTGKSLSHEIEVSSEDTYDYGNTKVSSDDIADEDSDDDE